MTKNEIRDIILEEFASPDGTVSLTLVAKAEAAATSIMEASNSIEQAVEAHFADAMNDKAGSDA